MMEVTVCVDLYFADDELAHLREDPDWPQNLAPLVAEHVLLGPESIDVMAVR